MAGAAGHVRRCSRRSSSTRPGGRSQGANYFADAVPLAVLLAVPGGELRQARPTSASRSAWWPLSPALLVLIFPLGFRLTCYYYRKAYYRAFWLSPPACAVAEPHGQYTGETRFPLILQNIHRYFFYVALSFAADPDLRRGARVPLRRTTTGDIGLGTLILLVNVVLIWLYTLSCHSCRHIVRRPAATLLQASDPLPAVDARSSQLNASHVQWPGCQPGLRRPWPTCTSGWSPPARSATRGSSDDREPSASERPPSTTDGIERTTTTSSSSAPAAPACARRSRPTTPGARTAIVCKSLLGKAHTVMAEGGIAAAMGNVWPEDNWQVHFRDTMRGGKMLNNWRMAQLHAQEAPDRVLELEEWGALFDRTADGLISSATSAATATRASPTSATAPAWR